MEVSTRNERIKKCHQVNADAPAVSPADEREVMRQTVAKLQEGALGGNVEAIKTLQELQEKNRLYELLTHIDEDESSD